MRLGRAMGAATTLCLVAYAAAMAEEDAARRTVSVTGTAVMRVAPDMVEWSISLRDAHPELLTAKEENDARVEAVLALVTASGVAPSDVATGFMSVSKEHQRDSQGNQGAFKHYLVQRSVTVRQRDLAGFESFLDALVKDARAEFSFTLRSSREEELRKETRLLAAAQAGKKAQALLETLGARVGRVLTVEEYVPEDPWSAHPLSNVSAAVPAETAPDLAQGSLAPGAIAVRVSVKATFEIVDGE